MQRFYLKKKKEGRGVGGKKPYQINNIEFAYFWNGIVMVLEWYCFPNNYQHEISMPIIPAFTQCSNVF